MPFRHSLLILMGVPLLARYRQMISSSVSGLTVFGEDLKAPKLHDAQNRESLMFKFYSICCSNVFYDLDCQCYEKKFLV